MNDEAIKAFTSTMGATPLVFASLLMVILIFFIMIAVIKVIKKGLVEVQENDNFDYSDYAFVIVRILAVFLVIAIFFGI